MNSQLFRDENDAQLRKPAMSIFGQGFKNKKKSFDVADDLGKANRTLRFQSEAGHNEMIGRQKTNNEMPDTRDTQEAKPPISRLLLIPGLLDPDQGVEGGDSEESGLQRQPQKRGTNMLLDQGGLAALVPKRRRGERGAKKTLISSKRYEYEEKQMKLEKEWQKNHAIAEVTALKLYRASEELLTEKAGESLFKKVQEKVEQKRHLRATVALFLILMVVNLANIIFLVGLNILLEFASQKYMLFLEGSIYMSDNMLAHRTYFHSFLMEIALAQNLVTNQRYQGLSTLTGNTTYDSLSAVLALRRTASFNKIVGTSDSLLKQAQSNPEMEEFYFAQANFTLAELQTDTDSYVSKWPFVSGLVFKTTTLVVDLEGQLTDAQAISNKADSVESTPKKSYLTYVNNYLRTNRALASKGFGQMPLDEFVSQMDFVPFMIYALVGIIVLMLLLTVTSFVLVLQQFERIHKSFAFLSLRDAQERLAQLKVVSRQMDNIEQSQYYYVNALEENYMMASSEADAVSKTSVLPSISKNSRQIFASIRLSVVLISFFYLLLAGICLAGAFLFSSRLVMVKWYHEKITLSEALSNNYLDYYNDINTVLILGDSIDYQLQSRQTYFADFDVKMNSVLKIGTDLPADSSAYPDVQDAKITQYLRSAFTENICKQISNDVSGICGKVDSEYTAKGLSQITSRLSSFYKQIYVEQANGVKTAAQILNDPSFVQVEAAAGSLYFPLMFQVYNRLVLASKDYLEGSFSTTGLVFSLLYLLAMLLFTAFSSLPYLSVMKQIRVVNFSFLLLSLNTYLRNVQLRQLMQEYLHLKYY